MQSFANRFRYDANGIPIGTFNSYEWTHAYEIARYLFMIFYSFIKSFFSVVVVVVVVVVVAAFVILMTVTG